MQTPALRPLGVGEVLDVSINLVRRNFATLARIVAVVAVPLQLLSAVISYVFIAAVDPDTAIVVDETTGTTEIDPAFWGAIGGMVLVGVVSAIALLIATAATTRAVGQAYVGEQPEWRESLRAAVGRAGGLLLLTLLVSVLGGIGLLLCIVPGLYVLTISAVAFPALLLEGTSAGNSFSRGRRLLKGRFLSTLGALFVAWLIMTLVQFAITAVVEAISFVSGDAGDALIGFVGGSVGQILTTPFVAAVAVVLYVDLRVRKEGFDLQLLARDVGSAPPGAG